jgi:hypothetical protein
MASQQGWIKLYRSTLENGWLMNHKLWVFWCYCLLKASHKSHKVIIGSQEIELLPGQFVFGRKVASKETGLSQQSIRTCVHNLKTLKNITIKSTNKYSIITIVNWGHYQNSDEEATSKPTRNQPALNHIQECKNKKNIKNINSSSEDLRLKELTTLEKIQNAKKKMQYARN